MTLQAALDAMTHDAKIWDDTSFVLDGAGHAASTLTVAASDVSCVADWTGFTTSYATVQAMVTDLLSQGASSTAKMAKTMRDVRDDYDRNDTSAAAKFHGVWDWKK